MKFQKLRSVVTATAFLWSAALAFMPAAAQAAKAGAAGGSGAGANRAGSTTVGDAPLPGEKELIGCRGLPAQKTELTLAEAARLEMDIDQGVRCSGPSCVIDKSLIDKLLANTMALATSARFVPSMTDGTLSGFKMYAIRPGSIFAKIGMQNADLIKAINGLDMSTPDKALEAYTKLKTGSHLTVMLERRGENITLDYQIR